MNNNELSRVHAILALAENASEEFIKEALKREDEYIILSVVPFVTSYEILTILASDSRAKIRIAVADNMYTPEETLQLLVATDSSKDLSCSVASHPNASVETLVQLSTHKEPLVRKDVVSNSSTPMVVLFKALDDENILVRSAAVQMLQQREDSPYYDYPANYLKSLLKNFKQVDPEVPSLHKLLIVPKR